jgi:hypothetical protein
MRLKNKSPVIDLRGVGKKIIQTSSAVGFFRKVLLKLK